MKKFLPQYQESFVSLFGFMRSSNYDLQDTVPHSNAIGIINALDSVDGTALKFTESAKYILVFKIHAFDASLQSRDVFSRAITVRDSGRITKNISIKQDRSFFKLFIHFDKPFITVDHVQNRLQLQT